MKTTVILASACTAIFLMQSCSDADARYTDLNTGKRLELKEDPATGAMVNAETGKAVEIYIDREKGDTIYGKTGKVINGKVRKMDDGRYVYVGNEVSIESDGSYSAKSADGDFKIKRTEDEYKIKAGDYKKEVEKDGDVTIKSGNKKIKIDGKTGEKKIKYDD